MTQQCQVSVFAPTILAVAREELSRSQIPTRIRSLFDAVYAWRKSAPVSQAGHNYAIYEKGTRSELLMRAGFPVSGRFDDSGPVACLEFPGGRVAHLTHIGPYSELHRSYSKLEAWCREQALDLSGQSWEIYGDWSDDPSKLETEICFRLRGTQDDARTC